MGRTSLFSGCRSGVRPASTLGDGRRMPPVVVVLVVTDRTRGGGWLHGRGTSAASRVFLAFLGAVVVITVAAGRRCSRFQAQATERARGRGRDARGRAGRSPRCPRSAAAVTRGSDADATAQLQPIAERIMDETPIDFVTIMTHRRHPAHPSRSGRDRQALPRARSARPARARRSRRRPSARSGRRCDRSCR